MEEKPICKKCQLYDPKSKLCGVVILYEGEKTQLKQNPNNTCFFEQEFRAINADTMEIERFKVEVQQVRMWVEDPKTGLNGKEGNVKIEYPVGSYIDTLIKMEEDDDIPER